MNVLQVINGRISFRKLYVENSAEAKAKAENDKTSLLLLKIESITLL
jgi:hypothetical protein